MRWNVGASIRSRSRSVAIPGTQPRLAAVVAGTIDATVLAPPFSFEAEKYNLTPLADFATGSDPFPQSGLVVRKELLRNNRDLVKRMLMAYVEAIHVLKTDVETSLPIMKKYMRITDEVIAKRSYEYYSKLFSFPPLTDEKGIGVVLKFLATQPGGAGAKSAKAEEFFDNGLLQELRREGFFARVRVERDCEVRVSVDPITVEIIRCALKAAANEMSAVLKKTAYNMMIYEVQDYCVAVLDHEGRTMSQNEGALPIFLADLGVAVQDGIEVYGKDNIHPGDVFLVNHPEICGQHLNNMAVYTPFFWEGELMCFLAVRAHWIDVGGGSTGFGSSNTRDVYEEGLQVRSVKIYKQGKPNTEVLRLIEDNIRFPESSLGDLRAQIACCRTGEERLEQICRSTAARVFKKRCRRSGTKPINWCAQSVRAIPDGVYEASSFLDDDGRVMNKTIPLKIKVEVRGDELTIDYSEVSDQVPGFINCGSSGGMAAARVAFKALTSPQREVNEGSFLALKVILPPGQITQRAPAGADRRLEPVVADGARHDFSRARAGVAGTRAGGAQRRHGRLRDFRHELRRPAGVTFVRISSAAAGAAGPSRTAFLQRCRCAKAMSKTRLSSCKNFIIRCSTSATRFAPTAAAPASFAAATASK